MSALLPTAPRPGALRRAPLRSSAFALALGLATLLPAGVSGQTAPQTTPQSAPTMLDRYRLADAYLHGGPAKLLIDADPRAAFTADGKGILYRLGPADARILQYFDIASGSSRAIVGEEALRRMVDQALATPNAPLPPQLDDAAFDPATNSLTFTWQRHWTLKDGKTLIAGAAIPATDEGLSPDGRYRIVARAFNLFAVDTRSGRELALTSDGSRDQPYGRGIAPLPEILKQGSEDPVLPVSVRWSPDSRRILTWRLDTRAVKRLSITQQNPPGNFYPRSFSYVYPLAGAPNLPLASRLIVDIPAAFAAGRATIVPVAMPAEALLYPADPDMGWIGDRARASWTERGYGQIAIYDIDPTTGAAKVVARETDKPLVTVTATALQPAPELGGELVVSERTGWAQLYLVKPADPDGGTALTKGAWEVRTVEHVDAAHHAILLTGAGREAGWNPYWTGLYRVSTSGSGTPLLLTPEPLDHHVTVSDDGRFGLDTMSSPTQPPETVLRDLSDGHIVSRLAKTDARALLASGFTPPEPFRGVAADGKTALYGMIFRPAHFDPTRHYPVIDEVYTGPTMSIVPTDWARTIRQDAGSVAQLGAIVVMIDARGTSNRGQAFRLPAYRNMGEVGLDDHIAMIRQMAARYPYMDTERAGVYGCSAGGYDAARFILRRPDFFKVSVATSGNHDQRLDKAWWPEVTMGNADPATWERVSNMSVAGQLKGKLMLVHGDIDANVPVTETFRLEKALIDAGRDVDVVILPNAGHCELTPYFWRKFRDYFVRNLLDEAPPTQRQIDAAAPAPSSTAEH